MSLAEAREFLVRNEDLNINDYLHHRRWLEARRVIADANGTLDDWVLLDDIDRDEVPKVSTKPKRTNKLQPHPTSVRKAHWTSIEVAADRLGLTPEALRKKLDRRVFKASDGVVESQLDGVRARKFGHSWRVMLSEHWEYETGASS